MKFTHLMQSQKSPQSLGELHAKAEFIAALNPRSRTVFLEACEAESKQIIIHNVKDQLKILSDLHNSSIAKIENISSKIANHINSRQVEWENALNTRKNNGLQVQRECKNVELEKFIFASKIPNVLATIQNVNKFDPLTAAFSPHNNASLPLRFRILSRANESYGANNWGTKLSNAAQNLFELLLGDAEDIYHSDFEPAQTQYLQGLAGNFSCNKMMAALSGYNYATGTAPMAAVGAFTIENTTDEDLQKSINFGLSSYNFAGVFVKVDEWVELFQTTSNLNHSSILTADFTIPANRMATILLVSTPYYYRYSSNTHIIQFLQWNIFNVRSLLTNGVVWRF